MQRTVVLRDELRAGVVAGIAGAILIDLFFFVLAAAGGASFADTAAKSFAFTASAAIGPAAAAANPPLAVTLGVLLHLLVSIAWALGYVYLARSQRHLIERPVLSGIGFGIVVYVFMNIVLIGAGLYHRPTVQNFEAGLVAHLIFFGLPIALIVARTLRTA